MHNKYIYII